MIKINCPVITFCPSKGINARRATFIPLLNRRPYYVRGIDIELTKGNKQIIIHLTSYAAKNQKLAEAALDFFSSDRRGQMAAESRAYIDDRPTEVKTEGITFRYLRFHTDTHRTEKLSTPEGHQVAEVVLSYRYK
ncbi:MAG: hypothetical protein U9R38_05715 [Candidatus Margulisiibacteriota bacterium]|nr:hypothetical protein [Candidatus Margulisiibacteriota bacterium]